MEMKRNLLLLIGLCMAVCVQAQKKNFSYKFYGQVRGDLFYNSRANAEIVDDFLETGGRFPGVG